MFSFFYLDIYPKTTNKKYTHDLLSYIYIGTRRAYGMVRLVILSPGHIYLHINNICTI